MNTNLWLSKGIWNYMWGIIELFKENSQRCFPSKFDHWVEAIVGFLVRIKMFPSWSGGLWDSVGQQFPT